MQVLIATVFTVLAHTVLAVPGNAAPHCGYKPDKCYNAVIHGPQSYPKGLAGAKSDCSSFFQTTVTPCPVTNTHIKTLTHTALPKTITDVKTICSTEYVTKTKEKTVVETHEVKTDVTVPVTITEKARATSTDFFTRIVTVEVTDHTTATVTVTTTATTVFDEPVLRPIRRGAYDDHKCKPVTSSPHNIPRYAEACGKGSAYSSACSCLGAHHVTTTLHAKTSTVDKLVTKTVTPTVTKHRTVTLGDVTKVKTVTDVTVVEATKTKTITHKATAVVTVTKVVHAVTKVTQTATTVATDATTVTTVVTETFTACPIVAVSGANQGLPIGIDADDDDFLQFKTDGTQAIDFYLDDQSRLASDGLLVGADGDNGSFMKRITPDTPPNEFFPLSCTVDSTTFILSCVTTKAGGANNQFTDSTNINKGFPFFSHAPFDTGFGEEPISLAFQCAPV